MASYGRRTQTATLTMWRDQKQRGAAAARAAASRISAAGRVVATQPDVPR